MEEIVRYILRFMLGEQVPEDVCALVGYTSNTNLFERYRIVIVPSGFFDEGVYLTEKTVPALPLENIEGVPFLYGTSEIEQTGNTIVVHADLVASAYFLISRYEEIIYREKRDEHGRFPGRVSLPFRAGFIDSPVVDDYGRLLRRWLRDSNVYLPEENMPVVKCFNLTHDVDAPFSCRTWRNVVRKIILGENPFSAIRSKFSSLETDKYYMFPQMLDEDMRFQNNVGKERSNILFFFKAGGNAKEDKPNYNLRGKDIRKLRLLCDKYHASIGLHCSYQAGLDPSFISYEKKNLEESFGIKVSQSRHHFLAAREPEDMDMLEKAGITDDYTMGYADVAGFRLGTSRTVRYINPVSRRLSSLRLHPLTVMDCTLNEKKYMNLTEEDAFEYCKRLMKRVENANGEYNLLWHNTSFVEPQCGYLKALYKELLQNLKL